MVLTMVSILATLGMGAALLIPLEASSVTQKIEKEQALFLAEAGLEYAEAYLEAKFPEFPPSVTASKQLATGTYTVTIAPTASPSAWMQYYQVTSWGRSGGATRVLGAVVRVGHFSKYAYYTDLERPDDADMPIWFASGDTITGPFHTNDHMHIMGNPVFLAGVSSSWGGPDDPDPTHWPSFVYYNGSNSVHVESAEPNNLPYDNPTFAAGYILGVPEVVLPDDLVDLQNLAETAGLYISKQCQISLGRPTDGDTRMHGYISYRFKQGQGFTDWADVEIASISNGVVFVNGKIDISGVLDGELTIASSDHIQILDDVVYRASTNGVVHPDCDDMLGLVAGGDILILDNEANRTDVSIHGSIMALTGSFRVENYHDGGPRGSLRLYGGRIQQYRGPISTGWVDMYGMPHVLTGYNKIFTFDPRFYDTCPPYFIATGQYEMVSWSESVS